MKEKIEIVSKISSFMISQFSFLSNKTSFLLYKMNFHFTKISIQDS